jgi:hypothetical protein
MDEKEARAVAIPDTTSVDGINFAVVGGPEGPVAMLTPAPKHYRIDVPLTEFKDEDATPPQDGQ